MKLMCDYDNIYVLESFKVSSLREVIAKRRKNHVPKSLKIRAQSIIEIILIHAAFSNSVS